MTRARTRREPSRRTPAPDVPSEGVATANVRCAIYTRKSTDEGLDQDFNSLDAQREAAEAFIASQRHAGWTALSAPYDDGGYSGGTIERPALQRLLADVEHGRVDCIVVYKVDRLSRSLLDFTRIIETLDRHGVSFVSVTQQFNTTSSLGRLTLNILLSFAQFEREIIGERIRDKVAAAKRKGKYTGGMPVLGYDVDRATKRLIVNAEEAKLVRHVFARFTELGSTTQLAAELNEHGHTTKSWTTKKGTVAGGQPWNKARLYRLLHNRKYRGQVTHKGAVFEGEHAAIVSKKLWDAAHRILTGNTVERASRARAQTPALLKGILRCGHLVLTSLSLYFLAEQTDILRGKKSGVVDLPGAQGRGGAVGTRRPAARTTKAPGEARDENRILAARPRQGRTITQPRNPAKAPKSRSRSPKSHPMPPKNLALYS